MTTLSHGSTGRKFANAMMLESESLAKQISQVATFMREYAALLLSKDGSPDTTAFKGVVDQEQQFIERVIHSSGAFLKDFGLPVGSLFCEHPIATPEQLGDLANAIVEFGKLHGKQPAEIHDAAEHFQQLATLTERVRSFFERLGNPDTSVPARSFYQVPRDRISDYPTFKAGDPINITVSPSGSMIPLSPTSLLVNESMGFTIIERISKGEWSHARFEHSAGKAYRALTLPAGRGFVIPSDAGVQICTRDIERKWQSLELGEGRELANANLGVHRDTPLVVVAPYGEQKLVKMFKPSAEGSWDKNAAASGNPPEPLNTFFSGPAETMIGIGKGKIYQLQQIGSDVSFTEIAMPPENISRGSIEQQETRSFQIFDNHTVCITAGKRISLIPYDAISGSWDLAKLSTIECQHAPRSIKPLADGRVIVSDHEGIKAFEHTSQGWRSTTVVKEYVRGLQIMPDGRLLVSKLDEVVLMEPDGSAWISRLLKGASKDYVVALPQSGHVIEFISNNKMRVWEPQLK